MLFENSIHPHALDSNKEHALKNQGNDKTYLS